VQLQIAPMMDGRDPEFRSIVPARRCVFDLRAVLSFARAAERNVERESAFVSSQSSSLSSLSASAATDVTYLRY